MRLHKVSRSNCAFETPRPNIWQIKASGSALLLLLWHEVILHQIHQSTRLAYFPRRSQLPLPMARMTQKHCTSTEATQRKII